MPKNLNMDNDLIAVEVCIWSICSHEYACVVSIVATGDCEYADTRTEQHMTN